MTNVDYRDAKVAVVTTSFSARAALYEHLFQYENAVSVEKAYTVAEGKDVLVIACNNSYGIPSDSAREALRSFLLPRSSFLDYPFKRT